MENEIISASISDRGLSEKRPQNEDSFAELPEYGVFAVADGVGGANAGDFASRMATELLTEAVANQADASDPEELLRVAITHANRSIHQTASELPQLSSMATTIVVLHLNGNIATVAHVGDSRIYRISPEGQLFRETNDHSVVEEEVRAGRMTPEQALVHPSRNIISRALGAEETVEVDVKTMMVEPNTTFLLCSDGITRHVGDEELQTVFSSGAEPRLICERLKELCYSRGAEDNLTAVVVRTFADREVTDEDFDSTVQVMEEDTVATARTAYAAAAGENFESSQPEISVEDTINQIDIDEIATGEHQAATDTAEIAESEPLATESASENFVDEPQFVEPLQESDTDEQFLLTETDESGIAASDSPGIVIPAQQNAREPEFTMFGKHPRDSYVEDEPSKSSAGRILISIGLLVLGGAIAVAGSYYLGILAPKYQVVEVPQVETMKTQDIPLTLFEETRRTVDLDPAVYAARTATPRDAADFYLMGRALLLSGKTLEAKRQFELAQERLPQTDEPERKTLSNEIKLALAVVNNPAALDDFKKPSSGAASNANINSAVNSPLR